MPTYLYRCNLESCQHEFETIRSIKSDFLVFCPHCEQPTLSVIPFAVPLLIENEPKTLGMLAERNTQKLGRYGQEDMWAADKERKILAREKAQEELAGKLPSGASIPEVPTEPVIVGGVNINEVNPKLNNLNKQQTEKYVFEGRLP